METIELERRGAVAWVWLNQPRRLNAIYQTTLLELRDTWELLDKEEAIHVIVLAARGRAFSAGFDVTWMAGLEPETVARELATVRSVYDTIEACAKPLIAAVQGAAMGGGLLLALVSDFRLASEQASFGVPEIKIGIFPSLALIPRLERIVGVAAAKRMVLTGDPVDALAALRMGLVDRVVPEEALLGTTQELADHLAALPSMAVQFSKAAFSAARGADYAAWETEHFSTCWAGPERAAAMRAFLNR